MQAATLWTEFHGQRTPPEKGQECTCPLCRGESVQNAQEAALKVDYASRLEHFIGPANVEAVRALDKGEDPRLVWLRWQEALLSPALAAALGIAQRNGCLTNQELREQDPALSPSTISNRLTELERRELLVKVEALKVPGGGRRYVYKAWDQVEVEDV